MLYHSTNNMEEECASWSAVAQCCYGWPRHSTYVDGSTAGSGPGRGSTETGRCYQNGSRATAAGNPTRSRLRLLPARPLVLATALVALMLLKESTPGGTSVVICDPRDQRQPYMHTDIKVFLPFRSS